MPVLAVDGIPDGRGLAVLALGADAAWVGTRFWQMRKRRLPTSTSNGWSVRPKRTPFTARCSTSVGRTLPTGH